MTTKFDQHFFNIFYGRRCNLACDGCSSGSDIVRHRNTDPDLQRTLDSIPKIADHFNIVNQFTLLGGDPFLYWNDRVVPIARELRKHFPTTKIAILTNGLLLAHNKESVLEFMKEIDYVNIDITNHFDGLVDQSVAQTWRNNLMDFLLDERIYKISNEHYHVKGNINLNITMHRQDDWSVMYQTMPDGKIKPYATKDPAGSMKYGCGAGNICSVLSEGRLWKCNALASVAARLKEKDQLTDPDWAPYLAYRPVDLLNINTDDLQNFCDTYSEPIAECDMCSNRPESLIKWSERTRTRVLPNKKETY